MPGGVYILKFAMVDPLMLRKKGKTSKQARFGDTLSVTIEVEHGNMGHV